MKYLLASGIYPPEIGGPATAIAALVLALREQGKDVVVVTYGEPRKEENVCVVSRKGPTWLRYLRFAFAIRRRLHAGDVLLATDVFSVGIPARLALFGKRNVFLLRLGGEWMWEGAVQKGQVHETLRAFWSRKQGGWRKRFALWNYRWILRRSTRVAVTSDLLGDLLKTIAPKAAGKLTTVWNASPEVTATLPVHEVHHPLRLLYIGRFARVKNVPFLAHVIRDLHDHGFPVACTFVGDGTELADVKQVLAGVPSMVFAPPTAHERLPELFAQADVHVLPSLSDICPNSVLESLALGVPVLITDEHGLPHGLPGVVEIPPTDAEAWVVSLHRLADPDAYRALRSAVEPAQLPAGKSLVEFCLG